MSTSKKPIYEMANSIIGGLLGDYDRRKFNYSPSTITNMSQFATWLDSLYPSNDKTGVVNGYITAAISAIIGLENYGHHFSIYSVSADTQLLVAYSTTGDSISTLYKIDSRAWNTVWKTVKLS